jgi:hypothetical protein
MYYSKTKAEQQTVGPGQADASLEYRQRLDEGRVGEGNEPLAIPED